MEIPPTVSDLIRALVRALPGVRITEVGDHRHPEAVRFLWGGRKYRAKLIGGRAHASSIEGNFEVGDHESRAVEKRLNREVPGTS